MEIIIRPRNISNMYRHVFSNSKCWSVETKILAIIFSENFVRFHININFEQFLGAQKD